MTNYMKTYLFLHVDFSETMKVVENVFKKLWRKTHLLKRHMDTFFFFVQSLLVTSAIIIQMLKYLFSSVPCNTKFVKNRKNSTFSFCKTQKLVFCVSRK